MKRTLLIIRSVFFVLCGTAGWLVCYTIREWDEYQVLAVVIGLLIGGLVILVDVLIKGFSLRALSAISLGLAFGSLIAYLIGASPLFRSGESQTIYLVQL